jgi:O-antigen/teichoic acid export membrane protein
MQTNKKSIGFNALMNMVNHVSGLIFPLITFPYVSRILQPDGLGKMYFAQAVVGYFIMIATLGIPLYGTREVAKVRDSAQELSQLIAELFVLSSVTTLLGTSLFAVFMIFSDKAQADPLLFIFCVLPIFFSPITFDHIFQGLEEFAQQTIVSVLFRGLALAATFAFVKTQNDILIYVLITGLNVVGANLLKTFLVRKYINFKHISWKNMRLLVHFNPAVMVFSLSAIVSVYASLDKVMLGYLSDDVQVGLYAASQRLINILVMIMTTIGTVFQPRSAYYLQKEQMEEYSSLAAFSLRLFMFLGFPIAFGTFALADPLILALAGQHFNDAGMLVKIMAINVILIPMSHFFGFQVLYPQNKEKLLLFATAWGALANFLLNFVLIRYWHSKGAAVATLTAEAVVLLCLYLFSRPYQQFHWPLKEIGQYGFLACCMGGLILFLNGLSTNIFIQIGMGFTVGSIFYLGVLLACRDQILLMGMEKAVSYIHEKISPISPRA